MELLEISHISKTIGDQQILKPINLSVRAGSRVGIMGETGSGKSTLLKIIAGLLQPTEGKVMIEGARVIGPDEKLLPGHADIGYLSQHFELRNNYRMGELLEMASKSSKSTEEQIIGWCKIGGLLERKNHEISGGERQRMALACTLLGNPKILLLDEPFNNLDHMNRRIIDGVVRTVCHNLNLTCLMVSHQPDEILPWADQLLIMKSGQVIKSGHPRSVYMHPGSDDAAGLTGMFTPFREEHGELSRALGIPSPPPLWVRPENLQISHSDSGGVEAEVRQVLFMGDRWLVELSVMGMTCWGAGMHPDCHPGQQVWVRFHLPK